jgi:hypothetical protein
MSRKGQQKALPPPEADPMVPAIVFTPSPDILTIANAFADAQAFRVMRELHADLKNVSARIAELSARPKAGDGQVMAQLLSEKRTLERTIETIYRSRG